MRGSVYIISAPSGAGKTSLVRQLCQDVNNIGVSISHTTRAMRPGEQEGKDYFFITPETFNKKVQQNEFLEYAQVFNNAYGTCSEYVENKIAVGDDVILEIDWQGAEQVRQALSDAISIFVLPPTRESLRERLEKRGQDSADTINSRMAQAQREMEHYSAFDYLIINDDFDTALLEMKSIIHSERLRTTPQRKKYAQTINELLA